MRRKTFSNLHIGCKFFYREGGSSSFFREIGYFLPQLTASQARQQQFQLNKCFEYLFLLSDKHNCVDLTFVFPCIFSVITIDNQQDATILIYLLLISSTCFGRCFSPIIRSSSLYLQLLVLSTDVAAGWCCVLGGNQLHPTRYTSQQQHQWTIPEAVDTAMSS